MMWYYFALVKRKVMGPTTSGLPTFHWSVRPTGSPVISNNNLQYVCMLVQEPKLKVTSRVSVRHINDVITQWIASTWGLCWPIGYSKVFLHDCRFFDQFVCFFCFTATKLRHSKRQKVQIVQRRHTKKDRKKLLPSTLLDCCDVTNFTRCAK